MGELIKKLLEAKRLDALESLDALQKAAKELGFSEDEVAEALDDFDGFPLDDNDLEEISGGWAIGIKPTKRPGNFGKGSALPSFL